MAVQQRRNSKTRKAKRRTHYKLVKPALTRCPNCGEYKLAHRCALVANTTANKSLKSKNVARISWLFL